VKKLQDKKEKTLKDEKALYQAENALEAATQDYNYFNDMMKEELPKLFELEAEFIRPLFQNFYYMQLNLFYTLNEKMRTMEIDYFDFSRDIEEQYEEKRGDVKEQAEALSIVHFKGTGRGKCKIAFNNYANCSRLGAWEIEICARKREENGRKCKYLCSQACNLGTSTPTTIFSPSQRCNINHRKAAWSIVQSRLSSK